MGRRVTLRVQPTGTENRHSIVYRARWVWLRTWVVYRLCVYRHHTCTYLKYHITDRKQERKKTQARPLEELEVLGYGQQGDNLCGTNARPTHELSLARGGGGEQRV